MPIPRTSSRFGPPILSYGLRPFFLLGALYAGSAILVWLVMLTGHLTIPTGFGPRDWHVHEMLYGYLAAVIAGYLLASIPNWTGRLPLDGGRLLVLVALWITGRLAVGTSAWTGWALAAVIDLSFLTVLALAVLRETLVGKTWRNMKIVAVLVVLLAGNLSFHLEAHLHGTAEHGARIGTAAIVVLVMLIGGRVVPSFTRTALAGGKPGPLPASFGGFDLAALAVAAAALASWVVAPDAPAAGTLLLLASAAQAIRLARWAGYRAARDVHVLVLHTAYVFVPVGFLLVGLAVLRPDMPASIGIHAWTGGAFGTMTIAVMTRLAAQHTRRPVLDAPALPALYALVVGAALARIAAGFAGSHALPLLTASALAWTAAFLGLFALLFRPLTAPRLASPKPVRPAPGSCRAQTTPVRHGAELDDAPRARKGG
ncbi:NnrS family protein [Salinarimonas ramus]|uniref:Short-chain dehydrogenase n=1 Tax=Salinarimonas ramus TaxID=690164 RepID=A0A917QHV9_9HYPH|nr:NnrS family protein [Salinarimonas ramus]GGK51516.1 short-chain dehydrogenase [Salinarimonas ramus]